MQSHIPAMITAQIALGILSHDLPGRGYIPDQKLLTCSGKIRKRDPAPDDPVVFFPFRKELFRLLQIQSIIFFQQL